MSDVTESLPLDGIRVLAIEQMIAAPWATQMLTRLGAEVFKVEHPTIGESGRSSSPTIIGPDGKSVGATYIRNNLNKRSIGIDIKRGADLVLDLAEKCDVFVQNSKAGSMEALGLGYDAVRERNPGVIYVSVTGFGNTTDSPYRDWPAYAGIAEGMSGIYQWARQPGQRPVINPMGGIGDIGSGMFATIGILSALIHRSTTGLGQHIDIAMYDSMLAIADVVTSYASLGETERAPGAIISTFAAADGDVVIQISREHQFERLATIVGHPEWLEDERFATRDGWVTHREDILRPAIEEWTSRLPKLEIAELLAKAGIPAGPCNDAADVIADPHVALRNMLIPFERPDGNPYLVPGNPVRVAGAKPFVDRRAPWLGEDTDDILGDVLGLDAAAISNLRNSGIIG
jgi:crotonobetainyl-CoA:carnitine CoA-transferase CaiB-like acyl-CoA transferase